MEMIAMRKEEGIGIFGDLEVRTNSVEKMTDRMEEGSREMACEWKVKLLERLKKADLSLNSEDDRVLKEVALFAEKCSIRRNLEIKESSRANSELINRFDWQKTWLCFKRKSGTRTFVPNLLEPVHLNRFGGTGRSRKNERTIYERVSQSVVDSSPPSEFSSFRTSEKLKNKYAKAPRKIPESATLKIG